MKKYTNNQVKQILNDDFQLKTGLYFSIEVSCKTSNVHRVFIHGRQTSFYANGYGYAVIAEMLNKCLGLNLSNNGIGISTITEQALKHNIKLEYITDTKTAIVYKLTKI